MKLLRREGGYTGEPLDGGVGQVSGGRGRPEESTFYVLSKKSANMEGRRSVAVCEPRGSRLAGIKGVGLDLCDLANVTVNVAELVDVQLVNIRSLGIEEVGPEVEPRRSNEGDGGVLEPEEKCEIV